MRYFVAGLWLMLSVGPALAASWPLGDVAVVGQGGQAARFIYVPPGQRFEEVRLTFELPAGNEPQRLAVRLDDMLIDSLRWRDRGQQTLDLPALTPGFHRLELRGWPALEALEQAASQCPLVLQVPPLKLRELTLNYRPVTTGEALLRDLPESLYNPSHPQTPVGWLEVEQSEAYGAAARLMSGWRLAGPVAWALGSVGAQDADFRVRLRRDEALNSEALIQLKMHAGSGTASMPDSLALLSQKVPTLEIRYRTLEGLVAAVHRLLDDGQRKQLVTWRAEVQQPAQEPVWAQLKSPESLADLGFEDLQLSGTQQRSLILSFPPHWQPTGPLQGALRVRAQAGLPKGSHLGVWVNDVLSGSQPLDGLASYDIQRTMPLDGSRAPRHALLGMRLTTDLEVSRPCTWPLNGSLWLDAEQSRLELPHLAKTGVMALVPRLLADSSVILDSRNPEAALQLLGGLMELTRMAATPHPLPYQIGLGTLAEHELAAAPSLSLLIDDSLQQRLTARYPNRVAPSFVSGALRWQADSDGRSLITAASPEVFRQAAAAIGNLGYRLPDGARDVLIHPQEDTLVVLDQQPRVVVAPARLVSRQQLEWGILGVAGVLLALLFGVLWLAWRRKRGV